MKIRELLDTNCSDVDYMSDKENYGPFRNLKEEMWETNDGIRVPIKDMRDTHIKNCIRFLSRGEQTEIKQAYIKAFENELKRRNKELDR